MPKEVVSKEPQDVILDNEDLTSDVVDLDADSNVATAETLAGMNEEQKREAEQFALQFLSKVIRIKGVKINREVFLRTELHKRGISPEAIEIALAENPVYAGVPIDILDGIAKDAIEFETKKSTAISFASGLPGGLALIATVPADITQFYVHAFRVMQKLAYVHGWQDFLGELDQTDDETMGILVSFLGVMMGVAGATQSVTNFAVAVARPAVQKKISQIALTKTAWYMPMKQTLRIVGVQVTKTSFAKATSAIVPVVGGIVAGSLTFVTLNAQSKRLRKYLRELPPPNVDAGEYLLAVKEADALIVKPTGKLGTAFTAAGKAVKGASVTTANKFRSVDLDGDGIPDEAVALTKAKDIGGAMAGAANAFTSGFGKKLKRSSEAPVLAETEDTTDNNPLPDNA